MVISLPTAEFVPHWGCRAVARLVAFQPATGTTFQLQRRFFQLGALAEPQRSGCDDFKGNFKCVIIQERWVIDILIINITYIYNYKYMITLSIYDNICIYINIYDFKWLETKPFQSIFVSEDHHPKSASSAHQWMRVLRTEKAVSCAMHGFNMFQHKKNENGGFISVSAHYVWAFCWCPTTPLD